MKEIKHWQQIYATQGAGSVGWYAPHLTTSIEWIDAMHLDARDAVIDVGGGASTLVEDLLASGYSNLTVLDLSHNAIDVTKQRLGKLSTSVSWLQGDITETRLPPGQYSVWHDREVFHFLLEPAQQRKYQDVLLKAWKKGAILESVLLRPMRLANAVVCRFNVITRSC